MFQIALTDHLEGPQDQLSSQIYNEVADLTRLADALGVRYAFFTEHHAHIHQGHLPTPLLFALHLASQTKQIHLGTAVICANLHHPIDIAEQVAVADLLTQGRLAPGFGSGSTPEELTLFNLPQSTERERHTQFKQTLETILTTWHAGAERRELRDQSAAPDSSNAKTILPHPNPDLPSRTFIAVNSLGAAKIAGHFNLNVLFSHLRTPQQYNQYRAAYQAAGGHRQIAANRPVYVGHDDATAWQEAQPALRTLWRRFQQEGKIPPDTKEPTLPTDLCAHPINFIVGGPQSVARQLQALHHQSPYDIANVELRWPNLSHQQVRQSLTRLMQDVMPLIHTSSQT
jgi:alkanesulfonate monooxygenase SsuD/methylene tetrahydromethanopterin reductase-like flavin-dependent oxidoreductase (luciferase family)